jgi:hypothetical protein
MPRPIHRGSFHLVHSVVNHQWWITMGPSGDVRNWSILSKHNTHAEALREWRRIHNEAAPAKRKKRRRSLTLGKRPLGL